MFSPKLRLISPLVFIFSFLCGSPAFAYKVEKCEGLFRVRLETTKLSPTISNIQLISKYAANINRVRSVLDAIAERPPVSAEEKVLAARTLGQKIAAEAFEDQPTFWRLVHVTLTDNRIPYSTEFYETLLETLFEAAPSLIHIETQKGQQYRFFKKLIDDGFQPLLQRELESATLTEGSFVAQMPAHFYSKQMWLRNDRSRRAETTLRSFWKEKAKHYSGVVEAEEDGRNLAEHIRSNASDVQTYARFYYMVMTQFQISQADAFYRGFLDQSFAVAFPKLDPRIQRHIRHAMTIASSLNGISLEVPYDRRRPPRPDRLLSLGNSNALDKAKAILREFLQRKTRTHLATRNYDSVVDVLEKRAAGDPSVYAQLLFVALTESRLSPAATVTFVEDAFASAQAYVFSEQDLGVIRDGLNETKLFSKTYVDYLWGTKTRNRGGEARLRNEMKQAGPNSGDLSARIYLQGENLYKFVQLHSKSNQDAEVNSSYARLIYIVLTEADVRRPIDFFAGFLNSRYKKKFSDLSAEDKDMIRKGITLAARKNRMRIVEIDDTPFLIRRKIVADGKPLEPRTAEEMMMEFSVIAIRNVLKRINEQGLPNSATAKNVGTHLAQLIEVGSSGRAELFLELFSISQTENSRPLPDEVRRAFATRVMTGAKAVGVPTEQRALLKSLMADDHDTILNRLFKLQWHATEAKLNVKPVKNVTPIRAFLNGVKRDFRSAETAYEEGQRVAEFLKLKMPDDVAYTFTHDDALSLAIVLSEVRASHAAFYRGVLGRSFRQRMVAMEPEDKQILTKGLRKAGLR